MSFPFPSGGYRYRTLRMGDGGWDVVALQYALGLKAPNGHFGETTLSRVIAAQRRLHLTDDGLVGPLTQRELCLEILWPLQLQYGTPRGLSRGMIEGESGYLLGNQSITYVRNGVLRADLGACQLSTPLHDEDAIRRALDPHHSISRLVHRLRGGGASPGEPYGFDDFHGRPAVGTNNRKAWWLACAGWNAPAYAVDGSFARASDFEQAWMDRYVHSKFGYAEAWYAEKPWPGKLTRG